MSLAIALLLGALTWTLLEYCIHRWLGHHARFRPNVFAKEHIRHHSQGDYFAPAFKKAGAALAALVLVTPPAILIAGRELGVAYAVGLVGFYAVYEILHRREHTSRGIGPYGRWARRHHFWHHFGDSSKNHGVTSPLWDLVFGTYQAPGIIMVPERLKMQWLTDPSTGDVHDDLRSWYELRRACRAVAAGSHVR